MNRKKELAALLALAVICIGAVFLYLRFKPQTVQGEKEVTVTVVHGDGTEKEFSYQTDRAYLGEVLTDNKLVKGDKGPYGLFIETADGERAEVGRQQWWCITKAGERVDTSADQTPILDGDRYELTLKEGY